MSLSLVGRSAQSVFYSAQASRSGGPTLLLGAADGELAMALAARGHRVVGVEPSAFLLGEARARPTGSLGQLQLLQSDLRTLRLPEQFALVLAPHNALTLAHQPEDLEAVLDTVRRHLQPTGAFVFDVSGLAAQPAADHAFGRPLFAAHFRERQGHRAIRRARRVRWSGSDLEAALAGAGLEPRERYADFDGRPWDEGDPMQVVVAGPKAASGDDGRPATV